MAATAERMRMMRERGLRELRLVVPDPRLASVKKRVAAQLARFPIERNRSIDKKTRKIKTLERNLVEEVYQLLRISLSAAPTGATKTKL